MIDKNTYLKKLREMKVTNQYRPFLEKIKHIYYEVSRAYCNIVDGEDNLDDWMALPPEKQSELDDYIDRFLYNRNTEEFQYEHLLGAVIDSLMDDLLAEEIESKIRGYSDENLPQADKAFRDSIVSGTGLI